MKNIKSVVLVFSLFSMLAACAHRTPNELTQISNLRAANTESSIDDIRLKAVQEAAATLGAQSGLIWQLKRINSQVMKHAEHLDKIFNFRQVILEHQVMPPVLVTADNIVNMGNDETLRVAEKSYAIIAEPRFISSPPDWRAYLLSYFPKPDMPDKTLLPKNKEETVAWNKMIVKNWQRGVDQANSIFESNLSHLKVDFNGMLLYKKLLSQKMITAPFVAETKLGITGSPEELRLNDRILRISKKPTLVTNPQAWQAAIRTAE